jgi:hypothetical protein
MRKVDISFYCSICETPLPTDGQYEGQWFELRFQFNRYSGTDEHHICLKCIEAADPFDAFLLGRIEDYKVGDVNKLIANLKRSRVDAVAREAGLTIEKLTQ